MKYLTIAIFNIAFIFSGFICAKSSGDSSPLPDKRPDDIRFSYSQNGGMLYYSENIFISKDSCYYKINDGGSVTRVDFRLSDAELDKLYEIFKDNDFDEIDSYEEKVYDRGGESISLNWKPGKHSSVSNSGMNFIKDSWQKEWSACSNAIEKIGKEQMEKQKKDYIITFDGSLLGKEIYMQINRDVVVPKSMLMSESDQESVIQKIVRLSPGWHNASITIGKSYNTVKINADSTKGLFLKWQNDSLKHEFLK
ncbi:MAG TPA: hypothetical protein PKE39_12200 [Ignavibacteria bacterium]|nr:hypothetical protein [Ignavibacteria bacterium]